MSGSGRGLLTLGLSVCSAAVAVTGVILGVQTDGTAGATATIGVPGTVGVPQVQTTPRFRPSAAAPATASTLWVDPANPAAKARTSLLGQGRAADAAQLSKIASQPTATWLTGDADTSVATVTRVIGAATAVHQLPVFVTYYLPDRDCGGYSAGGAASAAQYQAWVRAVAAALGAQQAMVIVEPDGVAMAASKSCAAATASGHDALLSYAVTTLARQPKARVYLDAGNAGWVANQASLLAHLRASGLNSAAGFALNVSNFRTLGDSLGYGNRLSALAGGAHYLVDTSRNGAGPLPAGSGYRGPSWCNPPGRALGRAPSTRTGQPLVDAYLWVKYPGASDGSCGLGYPAAGTFWTDYALGLAQRS
ncbi:MAG: glycoside hydrolase family 6 protein [Actinomycetota bacterium]|nr:glycoside hydrolase family 6 protein [Actinomycetota bacterium]MDQ2955676.1 glycoside hydrolase family 6 protein [Actinomycetota bacterium]